MSNQSTFGTPRQWLWLSAFMREQLERAERTDNKAIEFCENTIFLMAYKLNNDNPNFDAVKFIEDCGIPIANCPFMFASTSPDPKSRTDKCPTQS